MDIKWNFPNNGGGQIRGISDAGIETFTGTEIQSLAREICQNSLDAALDSSNENVYVEFENYKITSDRIPGYEDYKEKIKKAYEYWSTKKSEKTILYLKNAVEKISLKYTNVLRISDYNTTGLSDPYGESDDGWNALIKIDGGATKTGDKAGAFGIGKNAPFCNSDYRLVFYRTLNSDKEIAAQGVSRFISFPENMDDTRNTMTTGIGYYGNVNGNIPVEKIQYLDDLNVRDKVGTDVFVYGFNAGRTWNVDVTCEVLDNFLMAIYRNQLSVSVGNSLIDSKTLHLYIKEYQNQLKQAVSYYKVLSSPKTKVFTKEFHGMGTLKLSVLVDAEDKLNRKVLVTRTSGMKLFSIGNISRIISFSAILEMQGKELNEYFREMETPAHDKWVPGRYSKNPVQAKEYHNELKQWLRDIILSLGEYSSEEEIAVEGLGGVLQKESDSPEKSNDDKKESLKDTIGKVVIQPRISKKGNTKGVLYGSDSENNENNKSRDSEGVIGKGDYSATRNLGGDRKRKKKDEHKGTPIPGGRDTVHEKYGGILKKEIENIRMIKLGNGNYRVSFNIPKDIEEGHIELSTVGENNKSNKLYVKKAKALSNCSNINCDSYKIKFSNMKAKEKAALEFSINDNRDYAMEVNVYEHN